MDPGRKCSADVDTTQIHGLRDVIQSSLGEGDDSSLIPSAESAKVETEPPDAGGLRALGLGNSGSSAAPRSLTLLYNPAVTRRLCEVYLQQVDPVIKVLHRPSLSRWMVHGEPYLAYAEGHPSVEALGLSVCYSAISSMTEGQCSAMLHAKKADLKTESRMACETAIGRVGLLSTRDITVLQAFVLYLARI